MSLTSDVKELIAKKTRELSEDDEFQKLSDFYEEMKKEGIAKPPEYNLPPLDTIGRTAFRGTRL